MLIFCLLSKNNTGRLPLRGNPAGITVLRIKTQKRSELHSSICYIVLGAVLTGQNYVNYFLIVCDVSVFSSIMDM